MFKKIFFIFLLTFITTSSSFAEKIEIDQITLNIFTPQNYRDESNKLDKKIIREMERQQSMKFLKRYVRNGSNDKESHYVHIFIDNDSINGNVQTESDIEEILTYFHDGFIALNENIDTVVKESNKSYSKMNIDIKVNTPVVIESEKSSRHISTICLIKVTDNNNKFLHYSLYDYEFIYLCNTFFTIYSYCNFLDVDHLYKRIQEVKEQSSLFRKMLFNNNQDNLQNANPNYTAEEHDSGDTFRLITYAVAVLILLLGIFFFCVHRKK